MPTSHLATARPEENEYLPYYGKYISLVAGNNILTTLEEQIAQTVQILRGVSVPQGDYRYAPDKWSVKEVLGHLIDTERIMAYRALRISRNDRTPIEGYEQDDYVRFGPFAHCTVAGLVDEFASVRHSTVFLFRHLDAAAWLRRGVANKAEVSVRALAYIIAGHELHHRNILKEKYFSN